MKARVKETGEIIEVDVSYGVYVKRGTDDIYGDDALDFNLSEPEEEVTIKGWVARDKKDNTLNLHAEEPYRTQSGYQQGDEPDWWESECASFLPLDKGVFPSITWDSKPIEVKITIKPKKK